MADVESACPACKVRARREWVVASFSDICTACGHVFEADLTHERTFDEITQYGTGLRLTSDQSHAPSMVFRRHIGLPWRGLQRLAGSQSDGKRQRDWARRTELERQISGTLRGIDSALAHHAAEVMSLLDLCRSKAASSQLEQAQRHSAKSAFSLDVDRTHQWLKWGEQSNTMAAVISQLVLARQGYFCELDTLVERINSSTTSSTRAVKRVRTLLSGHTILWGFRLLDIVPRVQHCADSLQRVTQPHIPLNDFDLRSHQSVKYVQPLHQTGSWQHVKDLAHRLVKTFVDQPAFHVPWKALDLFAYAVLVVAIEGVLRTPSPLVSLISLYSTLEQGLSPAASASATHLSSSAIPPQACRSDDRHDGIRSSYHALLRLVSPLAMQLPWFDETRYASQSTPSQSKSKSKIKAKSQPTQRHNKKQTSRHEPSEPGDVIARQAFAAFVSDVVDFHESLDTVRLPPSESDLQNNDALCGSDTASDVASDVSDSESCDGEKCAPASTLASSDADAPRTPCAAPLDVKPLACSSEAKRASEGASDTNPGVPSSSHTKQHSFLRSAARTSSSNGLSKLAVALTALEPSGQEALPTSVPTRRSGMPASLFTMQGLQSLDDTMVDEVLFDEGEMESYLRSPAEVRLYEHQARMTNRFDGWAQAPGDAGKRSAMALEGKQPSEAGKWTSRRTKAKRVEDMDLDAEFWSADNV